MIESKTYEKQEKSLKSKQLPKNLKHPLTSSKFVEHTMSLARKRKEPEN